MEFLSTDNPEWLEMWEQTALFPINKGDALCKNGSLTWEYMGSTLDHHHLRHAQHPRTGKTEFIYIERRRAAVGWA